MLSVIATCAAVGALSQDIFIAVQTGTPAQAIITEIPTEDMVMARLLAGIVMAADEITTTSTRTLVADAERFGAAAYQVCVEAYTTKS